MLSLAKVQEPSGWMMWPVLAQSHPWTDVTLMDGTTSTAVGIGTMQEWCAEVYSRCVYVCVCVWVWVCGCVFVCVYDIYVFSVVNASVLVCAFHRGIL